MTVSKTATQEKARAYIEARFVSEWQQNILVPCFVDFADSLTAELQKENEELRDAVIWMSGSADFAPGGVAHEGWLRIRHLAALNPPKGGAVQKGLSKEDSRG